MLFESFDTYTCHRLNDRIKFYEEVAAYKRQGNVTVATELNLLSNLTIIELVIVDRIVTHGVEDWDLVEVLEYWAKKTSHALEERLAEEVCN